MRSVEVACWHELSSSNTNTLWTLLIGRKDFLSQLPLQNSDINGESAGDLGQDLHAEFQSLCIRHTGLSFRFLLSGGMVRRTSVQRKGNPSTRLMSIPPKQRTRGDRPLSFDRKNRTKVGFFSCMLATAWDFVRTTLTGHPSASICGSRI